MRGRPLQTSGAQVADERAPIRFGTSGWRGVLGDEVTYARLERLVSATAAWLAKGSPEERVLVGFDTRFASESLAELTCRVLARVGLAPVSSAGPVPTPILTHAVHRRRVAGGLMLTASHNPAPYHGLKVFGPTGCALTDRDARRIEALVPKGSPRQSASPPATPRSRLDLVAAYQRDVERLIDVDAMRRARVRVTYDAMHGTGAGVLDRLLDAAGCQVTLLRGERDAVFGGASPDPVPARLAELADAMPRRAHRNIGLATDGDADRFGVVLPGGRVLRETEVLALLVDHLARTGRVNRGLAISLATGSLVERVAEHHGLPVVRRPIGFKHLAGLLERGEADVAGEESGGFAWSPMGRDKDGVLAGVLLAELAATSRGGVGGRLAALERSFGRWACGRRALVATEARLRGLEQLAKSPPERVGNARVVDFSRQDGLRAELRDGFVMWRQSGTEPVLRIYAEAAGPRRLERRLDQAERVLASAARGAKGR